MNTPEPKKRGCRYWLRLAAVGVIGGVLMILVGWEWIYIDVMTRPAPSLVCCVTPADGGLEYEEVTLTSSDGITLRGWYIPSHNRAAVILLHGYSANRLQMLDRAALLAWQGYGVLLYDERASGESTGTRRAFGWEDVPDVLAALDYLQSRDDVDPQRIGILGFSVGGQIAIRAAAQADAIRAVVAEEPGLVTVADAPPAASASEWPLYAVQWIDDHGVQLRTGLHPPAGVIEVIGDISPRPLLLIGAGEELQLRLIRHYYEKAGESASLWEAPGVGHGSIPAAQPDEYKQRIVTFFDEALLAGQ